MSSAARRSGATSSSSRSGPVTGVVATLLRLGERQVHETLHAEPRGRLHVLDPAQRHEAMPSARRAGWHGAKRWGSTDAVNAVTSVTRCPCAMRVASVAPAENAASSRCGDTARTWSGVRHGDCGSWGVDHCACQRVEDALRGSELADVDPLGQDGRHGAGYRPAAWSSRRTRRCASAARRAPSWTRRPRTSSCRRGVDDPAALLLAGGSNVVVADDGVDATVVRVLTRGVIGRRPTATTSLVRAAAGEPWDDARRALRGRRSRRRRVPRRHPRLDRRDADPERRRLRAGGRRHRSSRCACSTARRAPSTSSRPRTAASATGRARSSATPGRWAVLDVTLRLDARAEARRSATPSSPARSASRSAPARRSPTVREAVLALRRGKGMVLDPGDHDTWSVGSFFTNPFVGAGPRSPTARRRSRSPTAR